MLGGGRRTLFTSRRGWLAALLLAAGLSSAGCSDGSTGPSGATVPEGGDASSTTSSTTSPSSTTVAAVSYDVPEVIDQAYVQRVVSAYDQILGDAIRVLKRDGALTEEFLHHLLAIYTEQEFESQQRGWAEAVAQGDLQRRPAVPGDPVTHVVRIARADAVCVTAEVDRDFRPTLLPQTEPAESAQPDYVVLVRKRPDRDPEGMNPTPWVMAFDGFKIDGSEPVNSCGD